MAKYSSALSDPALKHAQLRSFEHAQTISLRGSFGTIPNDPLVLDLQRSFVWVSLLNSAQRVIALSF